MYGRVDRKILKHRKKYSLIIGYSCDWRWTAFMLLVPAVIMTLLMILLPETPYWLIENNDYNGAKKSLRFFRGKEHNITEEFNEISQKHESKLQNFTKLSWKFKIQRIFSRAFFKPFSCVGILNALSSWTGASIFEIYMIDTLTGLT